jgi:UDP-N-acetyl-D-mannosaminuronic acid dehydrogenase
MSQDWKRIAVVGGCGHVGLPLGLAFATRGVRVTLLDRDAAKVDMVNTGQMPFRERGGEEALGQVAGKTLIATLDPECLRDAQAVVTVIGTPVDRHLNPTLNELYRGVDDVLQHVADGTLFVLRSTVYPGVTRLTYSRIRSLGRRIPLAFCPERIAEGKALEELETLPQIVSAFDPEAMAMARELFLLIAPSVIELDPIEAELAKLFTNSWRYLNFAISNQFYMIAQSYGLDFYRIYDAVTRDYPRMKAFSRPGFAAGPCLLKDTLQLAAFCNNTFFMGHAAMLVNEGLPNAIVAELRMGDVERQCVAILGMAFKGDSDDKRESLSYRLRNLLSLYAKEVICTDPYVCDPTLVPLDVALEKADVIVLGAPHTVYRGLSLPPGKKIVDIWNFWEQGERPLMRSLEPSNRPAE